MPAIDHEQLASALMPAVLAAGAIEMRHYHTGVAVESKADESPVTIADRVWASGEKGPLALFGGVAARAAAARWASRMVSTCALRCASE